MNTVVQTAIEIIGTGKVQLDDFVDRLCYKFTPMLLAFFALLTGSIDTFGKPINCMVPAEFTEIWSNFVHQYCYVTGTYVKRYVADGTQEKVFVDYYQWVPFVLIIQAFALYLPYSIWDFWQNSSTDVDFSHINSLCTKSRTDDASKRVVHLDRAVRQIYQVAKHRDFRGIGSNATGFYMLFKLLNVVVIVGQLYFLARFFGNNSYYWGITFAQEMLSSNSLFWNKFSYFPRIAYCSFGRDFLGSTSGDLIQEARCTLGVNIINEKVFVALYFWLYFLLLMTSLNLFIYIRSLLRCYRTSYVKHFLSLVDRCDELFGVIAVPSADNTLANGNNNNKNFNTGDRKTVAGFVSRVLGNDGVLLLHFIKLNNGELVAVEVCSRLFHIDAHNKK